MKKCIVLFSGGLDSRLVIKIMQEEGFEVIPVYFKLPFSKDVSEEAKKFCLEQELKLEIVDCCKGKLLKEYLSIVKKPCYGFGAGANPCIDCKIFIFKHIKKFAKTKNIDLIVSGDVLDERPMSQKAKQLRIIEEKSGLKGRIFRPLSAKILPKTKYEGDLIESKKFYSIKGKQRKEQIALAKKFKIHYPEPAGGCLLCEKQLAKRFRFLCERGLNSEELKIIHIGRHFVIDDSWVVLGKDKKENKIIESLKKGKKFIPDFAGPTAIIFDKCNNKKEAKIKELIKAYSKKGEREKFEECKL